MRPSAAPPRRGLPAPAPALALAPDLAFVPVLAALGLVAASACQEPELPRAAAGTTAARAEGGAPRLGPPSSWRRLGPEELVSPAFSPSGQRLAARGRGGVGLFVYGLAEGALVHAEPALTGSAALVSDDTVCLPGGAVVRLPGDAAGRAAPPCALLAPHARLGERVGGGSYAEVFTDAFAGTITVRRADGSEVPIEARGPWHVAATADGRRIAFCEGPLAEPELYVVDLVTGRRLVGRGAQPAWFPDGRHLVFARPTVVRLPDGQPGYRSELHLYDAETGAERPLTDTDELAEMEPAVAPDGAAVAFADWQNLVVHVAAVEDDAVGGAADRRPR